MAKRNLEDVLDHIANMCKDCEPHAVPALQCLDEIMRICVTREIEGHIKDCDGQDCEDGEIFVERDENGDLICDSDGFPVELNQSETCPVCKGIGIIPA